MRLISELDELRAAIRGARDHGFRIALVPTMGNLHDGHLGLVRRAQSLVEFTIVSIFVNPFQFGPNEDFASYPITLDRDQASLFEMGVNLLFTPDANTVYPLGEDDTTHVEVSSLSKDLCGVSRPNFFRGVATVVNMLFNMVQPDIAVFGEKDYQQALVIRRMVSDLFMNVDILIEPTAREPDGVAMSSRNRYLTVGERKTASQLYKILDETRAALRSGNKNFTELEKVGFSRLEGAGFRPDYFSIRRADNLAAPGTDVDELVVLAAAWLGKARLIDNVSMNLRRRP